MNGGRLRLRFPGGKREIGGVNGERGNRCDRARRAQIDLLEEIAAHAQNEGGVQQSKRLR